MHKIYVEELTSIHFGQAWDIYWQNSKAKVPTQAQYLQMVENKNSVLPRMCLRMITEQTEQSEELKQKLIEFVNDFGAAFHF